MEHEVNQCFMDDTIISHYRWSSWRPFPNPTKGEYLCAPFGFGVYHLRRKDTKEYVLFGKGSHVAYRMSSLLPAPWGCGTRNNHEKREYVLRHIDQIEYQTVSFTERFAMDQCERELKNAHQYLFNS